MKVSDYIIKFLEKQNVTEIFGYPGVGCGHFMDSLSRSDIKCCLCYHEQATAFAACSYAQASHKPGIAFSTAGPGCTNLITGIANAYSDSIPAIFFAGNKDSSSLRGKLNVRQLASQEVDIVSIAAPVCKWSVQVTDSREIRYVLEKAFYLAQSGRPGPVLLDIPSDIQRDEVKEDALRAFQKPETEDCCADVKKVLDMLQNSEKPLILAGNGIKQAGLEHEVLSFARQLRIPVVSSLVCFDLFINEPEYLGFIGMDGTVAANRAVLECGFLITLGARLNFKQVCNNRKAFAPNAKVIRIDCDKGELSYRLRDETGICADVREWVPKMIEMSAGVPAFGEAWLNSCQARKEVCKRRPSNLQAEKMVRIICGQIPKNTPVTADTGSHRRWIISQMKFKPGQRFYQSAGLASMGYALPAAVGVYYAKNTPVVCFDGDGGLMMNLQELQCIACNHMPVTIIVLNNHCLGDIMEFQKRIMKGSYFLTTSDSGYAAADFEGIAKAFQIKYVRVVSEQDARSIDFTGQAPQLVEVIVPDNIYADGR